MIGASPLRLLAQQKKGGPEGVLAVTPVEDLMREHGALNRILLIYEEAIRRIRSKKGVELAPVHQSARIIRDFIEGYHEKLEEEHLFPRLKKAGHLAALVDTLTLQHHAGRKLTQIILNQSGEPRQAGDLSPLASAMAKFIRMYRPHEAREDTVVFPEFKKLLRPKEYQKLGDQFEDREHQLFGKAGFEGVLAKIVQIEKSLGIYDLTKFTPQG